MLWCCYYGPLVHLFSASEMNNFNIIFFIKDSCSYTWIWTVKVSAHSWEQQSWTRSLWWSASCCWSQAVEAWEGGLSSGHQTPLLHPTDQTIMGFSQNTLSASLSQFLTPLKTENLLLPTLTRTDFLLVLTMCAWILRFIEKYSAFHFPCQCELPVSSNASLP